MKTKFWILLLAGLLILCLALSFFLMRPGKAATLAQVRIDDTVITVSLLEDQEFTLHSLNGGYNTVTVRDGKIAVTEASCPDQYCVQRMFCDGGTPIVCLPNKLVIEFLGESEIDGKIG